jgi:MFS family permease
MGHQESPVGGGDRGEICLSSRTTTIEAMDGLPLPRRYWAIRTIAIGLIMAVTDGAIANVTLPTIGQDLHASPAFSIWIVKDINNRTMVAAAPRERSGGASGMRGTACLLGQTIGAALVALLLERYSVAAPVMPCSSGSASRSWEPF